MMEMEIARAETTERNGKAFRKSINFMQPSCKSANLLLAVTVSVLASCGDKQPSAPAPPLIGVVDQRASAYLTPAHRSILEKQGSEYASAAAELANYYLFFSPDRQREAFWRHRYEELRHSAPNPDPSLTLAKLTTDQLIHLAREARGGDSAAARAIADYYLNVFGSEVHALPWMELAAQLGDIPAASYATRLKVAVGVLDLNDVTHPISSDDFGHRPN
jgi:hypothetical protein